MQVCSPWFLLFLGIIACINYILPQKVRYIWLFAGSMFFYGSLGLWYLLFLWIGILTTYGSALLMERSPGRKKTIFVLTLLLCIGALFYFKYAGFLGQSLGAVQKLLTGQRTISFASLLLPVGISFYLFMSMGYLIDVYEGRILPEKNLIRYALFVSFFPTICSGPIERAGNMLPQFREPEGFDEMNVRKGICQIIWGFFLKMILADRISIVVNTVYADPAAHKGTVLFLCVLLYSLQIYCDFGGYSSIAVGSARILGYRVMDNFNAPYLSGSVGEFWRRWHISLSAWFRDYLYIPLGGNRKGTLRKYCNVMIVFLVSGLWHGAAWTFVVWGGLHGFYQVAGRILMPLRDKMVTLFHMDRSAFSHRVFKTAVTFLLVSIAWVFFRADTFLQAGVIIKDMWQCTPWVFTDGTLYGLGLDAPNVNLLLCGLALLILADVERARGIILSEVIARQGLWLRWLIYIAAIVLISVCGVWGNGYDAGSFIYVQF